MTIISDLMAKFVEKIKNTEVQSVLGINITQLNQQIKNKKAQYQYKYTILLVGINNVDNRSRSVYEIMSYYNDLITTIKSRFSTKISVSAIIPRPCDLKVDHSEKRVKDLNKELKKMCERRYLQF